MFTGNIYRYSRFFVGFLLILGGLNKFFDLIAPMEMPAVAVAFMEALGATGYFIPFLGIFEVAVGLMFWSRKATPLASIALVPWSVNVLLFHAFLAPASAIPAAIIVAGNLYFLAHNWSYYRPMLEELSLGTAAFHRHARTGIK